MPIKIAALLLLFASIAHAQTATQDASPTLRDERPATFTPTETGFDYAARHVDIPMRDGTKLHAVILTPKGAAHAPILLTRTPYNAEELAAHRHSSRMAAMVDDYDNIAEIEADGRYIRVIEDVRGKYKSEGDYVMNRPWKGPLNPTEVDDPSDTYDTIEWLIHNVPETNGRVGLIGVSYDGFTVLMGLIDPHPALRAAVPMNPMVDGWMGDDWFHKGAFRQINLSYIYEQEATRENDLKWWETHYDDYSTAFAAGSVGALGAAHGMEQLGFYAKLLEHPAYDRFWQDQAVDKKLGATPVTVPTLIVHSEWDQEDIYGALAVWRAVKPHDAAGNVFLAMGPWHHGQAIGDGDTLGAIRWGSDTSLWFRENVLRPFLDHNLLDEAPPLDIAPATVFEGGTNVWRRLPTWPAQADADAAKLFLLPDGKLGLGGAGDASAIAAYVSDPAKPIPFHPRPTHFDENDAGNFWLNWLADDQRDVGTRTDVLTFQTEPLAAPIHIAGTPVADLNASTTGTDADFVVKLIDVYPDEMPRHPGLSGYQFMVSADILRGRYREGFDVAKPIAANQALRYRFTLPDADYVFLPGHRIMVQVQSSWFPLYDRNPQTFVPNIFLAQPADYVRATVGVVTGGADASFVELPSAAPP